MVKFLLIPVILFSGYWTVSFWLMALIAPEAEVRDRIPSACAFGACFGLVIGAIAYFRRQVLLKFILRVAIGSAIFSFLFAALAPAMNVGAGRRAKEKRIQQYLKGAEFGAHFGMLSVALAEITIASILGAHSPRNRLRLCDDGFRDDETGDVTPHSNSRLTAIRPPPAAEIRRYDSQQDGNRD